MQTMEEESMPPLSSARMGCQNAACGKRLRRRLCESVLRIPIGAITNSLAGVEIPNTANVCFPGRMTTEDDGGTE